MHRVTQDLKDAGREVLLLKDRLTGQVEQCRSVLKSTQSVLDIGKLPEQERDHIPQYSQRAQYVNAERRYSQGFNTGPRRAFCHPDG
jgi:hypothetical protein